jgi:L-iditol 2-dehydrogenase
MMEACLLRKQATMSVVELPIPELPPGGLLIRTKSVGLCGSDVIKVLNTISTEERVIGHEITGEVVNIDERANYDFKPGDRVAVGHVHVPCMHCHYCRHGSYAMCRQFKESHVVPGGFSQYVALSADHAKHTVLAIPDSISYDHAVFIDPIACCLHAINRLPIQSLDRVIVLGAGVMGALFIQLLQHKKARVIAVDISDTRLKKAQTFGADHTLNALKPDVSDEIDHLTEGLGADAVILSVVNQQTINQALSWVRDGGWLSLFAGPIERTPLNLDFYELFRREVSLVSSYSASLAEMGEALSWIQSGLINLEELITGTCDLEGILPAINSLDETEYKVIVHP